jgi:hypothetical protein
LLTGGFPTIDETEAPDFKCALFAFSRAALASVGRINDEPDDVAEETGSRGFFPEGIEELVEL